MAELRVTNVILAEAYARFKKQAAQIKNLANNRATLLTADISETNLRAMLDNFTEQRDRLAAHASQPGLAAYAIEQEDDDTYDVVADYQAMKALLDAVITTLESDIPAPRMFTPAQTASLKAELEALDVSMI